MKIISLLSQKKSRKLTLRKEGANIPATFLQPAQVFSCEFCEIFKNTFFIEHIWMIASAYFMSFEETFVILFDSFKSVIKRKLAPVFLTVQIFYESVNVWVIFTTI